MHRSLRISSALLPRRQQFGSLNFALSARRAASDDSRNSKSPELEPYVPYHILKPDVVSDYMPNLSAHLASQLSNCPLGYATTMVGPKTLVKYVQNEKVNLSVKDRMPPLLLVKVGEFYESFGFDAGILIAHGGLNSMGGKLRAGMPLANIQSVVDRLFQSWPGKGADSLEIAVYEEFGFNVTGTGLKNRKLQQILRKGEEEYFFNLHMGEGSSTMNEGVRVILVRERLTKSQKSYDLYEIEPYISRCSISSSLPLSSLLSLIDSGSVYKDTVYFSGGDLPSWAGDLEVERVSGGEQVMIENLGVKLFGEKWMGVKVSEKCTETSMKPLNFETAKEIGVVRDHRIASLVAAVIGDEKGYAADYVRDMLLRHKGVEVGAGVRNIVKWLTNTKESLPERKIIDVKRVIRWIREGECSRRGFIELRESVERAGVWEEFCIREGVACDLGKVVEYDTAGEGGRVKNFSTIRQRVLQLIENTVAADEDAIVEAIEDDVKGKGKMEQTEIKVNNFFVRNDRTWQGRVKEDATDGVKQAVKRVEHCKERLVESLKRDFYHDEGAEVVVDIFNNALYLRCEPADRKGEYMHPKDRNNRLLRNRYTTEDVNEKLRDYIGATQECKAEVAGALKSLSADIGRLEDGLDAILECGYINMIIEVCIRHVAEVRKKGWTIPDVEESMSHAVSLNDVFPYWMGPSSRVTNDVKLNGMCALTAPNMSGKSTVMRSVAAAALLASAGMYAPVGSGSRVGVLDAIFVRGASGDAPNEGKSAFGAEIEDIGDMFGTCSDRSLVFVDELGRGTSPTDGASIAAAVLEEMAKRGINGFFATHLFEIFRLIPNFPPEVRERIINKRMAVDYVDVGGERVVEWTYKLEDGVCKDSMALVTARKFGLPEEVLDRAREFQGLVEGRKEMEEGEEREENWGVAVEREIGDIPNLDLGAACNILEAVSNASAITLPAKFTPPPYLEGRSCVYVLEVPETSAEGGSMYYVGESDGVGKRLKAHRSKRMRGLSWSNCKGKIVEVEEGKGQARRMESEVIKRMEAMGFGMISVADKSHTNFGGGENTAS